MKLGWKITLAVLISIIILSLLNKYSNEGFLSSNKTGYVMSGDGIVGTIPVENIITITTQNPHRPPDDPPIIVKAYLAQNATKILNHMEITDPSMGKEQTNGITATGNILGTIIKYDPQTGTGQNKFTVNKQGSPTMARRPFRNPTGYTLSGGDIKSSISVLRIIDMPNGRTFFAQDKSKIIVYSQDSTGKPCFPQGYATGNMIGNINTINGSEYKLMPLNTYTLKKI
jgi:hypothetical protein